MNQQRVVITGVGVISPLGLNTEEFWSGLVAGKSGICAISRFDTANFPVKVAAEVKGFNATDYVDPKVADRSPRCVHFASAAANEAIKNARLDMSKENRERVGVLGSNLVENDYIVRQSEAFKLKGPRRADPLFVTKASPNIVALQVGMILGAEGPNTSVNSLCASGADAIGNGLNFIRLGYADVMVAACADASLEAISLAGLNILGALSREPDPAKACRPFDLNRSGFVYGEGSGVLILETLEHAKKRGAPVLAELLGAGWSFDAFDTTAPRAETQARSMSIALRSAGIRPEDVDYINAHGTSTKLNDACETKAIKMVFGERAYKIPISANKSMFGHIIAAAGAVEAIAAVLTLERGIIPPTINYETPDPECDLDYVPNVARQAQANVCLSNSFGIGGQNCTIILKRFEE
ncbi:MAG: beta-ketoacyl-ACP synthase II [Chloroflexi bacterium]|nr:beta-ketoacyl-ACP synthase II [Chloroflexota bacterium]